MSVVKKFKISRSAGHQDNYDIGAKAENVIVDLGDDQTTTVQDALGGVARISEDLKTFSDDKVLLSKKEGSQDTSLKVSQITGERLSDIDKGISHFKIGSKASQDNALMGQLFWTKNNNNIIFKSNIKQMKVNFTIYADGQVSNIFQGIVEKTVQFTESFRSLKLVLQGDLKFKQDEETFVNTKQSLPATGQADIYYIPTTEEDRPFSGVDKSLVDLIYPVGSIYFTTNSLSPAYLFGGKWERIKDKFLLGSGATYINTSEGGSATVTLTANQSGMPSHYHTVTDTNTKYSLGKTKWKAGTSSSTTHQFGTSITASNANASRNTDSKSANATQAHDNMPPYLVVNIWKRTQ